MRKNDPGHGSLEALLSSVVGCARDIWLRGWAENGAGNMSVRVDPCLFRGRKDVRAESSWMDLESGVSQMAGAHLLMTARGSLFRCLGESPRQGIGVIEIDDQGMRYRVVWGYEPHGAPSSEMQTHLAVHAVRGLRNREAMGPAVVHAHAPNLVALTCALGLNTRSLTRLLWSLHAECVALFPEGIEVAPWRLPGSVDLSDVTARALETRRMVVWPFHGVVAVGRTPDEAMGLMETGEKAAELYLKASMVGGPQAVLTAEDLEAIAERFGVNPDEAILLPPEAKLP